MIRVTSPWAAITPLLIGLCGCRSETIVAAPSPAASVDAAAPAVQEMDAAVPEVRGAQACSADRNAFWTFAVPTACVGKRTCIDARYRFWVNGRPFRPRGVYNGGSEYLKVMASCPAGSLCEATTPHDAAGYVKILADAGINLFTERSRFLAKEMLDAIHAEPGMQIAHLLWNDPFTKDGHDAMVTEIEAAAADPKVVMWFGPDEVDYNDNWAEAAGIRRLLRGSSPALDELLHGAYTPKTAMPFLPDAEPAHDPHALPFGAALNLDRGIVAGTRVYDALMPVTYPFTSQQAPANTGRWGTQRLTTFATQKAPFVPVLQLVGISEMGLSQPTPNQLRAVIASALARGGRGEYYYTLFSDKPSYLGREGWFAPDAKEAWSALIEMHKLEDAMTPIFFGEAAEAEGRTNGIEWRSWTLAGRKVVLFVNPTSKDASVDLDAIVASPDAFRARTFDDCEPLDEHAFALAGYGVRVVEALLP